MVLLQIKKLKKINTKGERIKGEFFDGKRQSFYIFKGKVQ